ncbi:hypothetical protein DFH07DRAFT_956132 [Mycena maculata]|uniref:Uncharacterized protein n=1 Tax=Mycena maculata TaxID=230809 RepID=A0AAD7JJH4_9AGAR|nr:hypothetical protein DFH07DRAFT_956132 [Mycena maculata]
MSSLISLVFLLPLVAAAPAGVPSGASAPPGFNSVGVSAAVASGVPPSVHISPTACLGLGGSGTPDTSGANSIQVSGATSLPIPSAPLNASAVFQSGTTGNVAFVAASDSSGSTAEPSGSSSTAEPSGSSPTAEPSRSDGASSTSGTAANVAIVTTDAPTATTGTSAPTGTTE